MDGTNTLVFKATKKVEDMDKTPSQVPSGPAGAGGTVVTRSKRSTKVVTSSSVSEGLRLKQIIVDSYKSPFMSIWQAFYIRTNAVRGKEIVFQGMLAESFNTYSAESISSEITKIVSVVTTTSIKQPSYVSNKYKNSESSIATDIPNKYLDKLYYKNIRKFTLMFEETFEGGISFLHVDSQFLVNNFPKLTTLSPYNCMWDFSVPLNQLSEFGAFFLIEEFVSRQYLEGLFKNIDLSEMESRLLDEALRTSPSIIDTFPSQEADTVLLTNLAAVVDLNIVAKQRYAKGEKPKDFSYSFSPEKSYKGASHSHGVKKLTIIYSRGSDGYVTKLMYVNDLMITAQDINSKLIPIVSCAPLEKQSHTFLQDRYRSLYDNVSGELKTLAILYSSIACCAKNSANNSIFVSSDLIPAGLLDPKIVKNNLIPVKTTSQAPIGESIFQATNPGMPPGIDSMIAMLKMSISQKLNIITQEGASKSAQQEQLRVDNQVRLSSYMLESLETSISQFGEIMKDVMLNLIVLHPEVIQSILPVEEGEIDVRAAENISAFLNDCNVVLEESEYYTTQGEKDLQKLERLSMFLGPDKVPLPLGTVLKIANVSKEVQREMEKATLEKARREDQMMQLEMKKLELEELKARAEIAKANAAAQKDIADSIKKDAEAKEIQRNMKQTQKEVKDERKT